MNSLQSAKGTIARVQANGSGPNSAEVLIRLLVGQDNESFFLFFPKQNEREQFFKSLSTAFKAMWDTSTVLIDFDIFRGDQRALSIKVAPLKQ
jgi:hypothetical protein